MNSNRITNIEVKKNNRNRIFRHILKCKTVSNPEIAYDLKISLPTVTQNTKELIDQGLIRETGELKSTGGRRAKALSAAADFKLAVGLDITQNHIALLLTNLTGEILKYERMHQTYLGSGDYYQEICRKLEAFLKESSSERDSILGIGISFPGIVDLQNQKISYSHALGIKDLPFREIEQFFPYPVSFLNDANAGAYTEGILAEKEDRFFYLSLSNTVGGAIFYRGQLIQGNEFRCGEAGHMTIVPDGRPCYCGKSGCLDAYCSAKRLSDLAEEKLQDYFEGLKQGKETYVAAWEEYTDYLAIALNNLHMVLDCDIILGGYAGSYLEDYIPKIREKVSGRNTFSKESGFVKPCRYKVGAAAHGAALQVIEEFIEQV